MADTIHKSLQIPDRSYVALAKKEIHALTEENGFNREQIGEIDIIVAEITSNLIKHANGGELLVRMIEDHIGKGIELICIDNGRGIHDPVRMMEDGTSTTNTLGHGLGSMKRLSDTFQIYSQKDWGTILLSRKYTKEPKPFKTRTRIETGIVIVPKPGETDCGDGYCFKPDKNGITILVADGLGHGPEAKLAVDKAKDAFNDCNETTPAEIIRYMHPLVKKTRGLVATVANYSFHAKKWLVCGVGNINTRAYSPMQSKNYICYNGIVGMTIPNTMKNQEIEAEHGQILIMCSDGIKSRWDPQKYPGIHKYDTSIFAAAIYKDHARQTDDMSVIIIRIN